MFQQYGNKEIQTKGLLILILIGLSLVITISAFVQKKEDMTKTNKAQDKLSDNSKQISELQQTVIKNILNKFTEGFFEQVQIGDPSIQYFIQNPNMIIGFGESKLKILLKDGNSSITISQTFENSNRIIPVGVNPQESKSTYFIGHNQGQKKQIYSKIVYKNIYNDIDLEFMLKDGILKYNYLVYPGGNPNDIQIQWNGPIKLNNTKNGMQITIRTSSITRQLLDTNPISFQKMNTVFPRTDFVQLSDKCYGFIIGPYDKNTLLVIDPSILLKSSFFGGTGDDRGYDIAMDKENNIYIAGTTNSPDFPIVDPYNETNSGNYDIFVYKISASNFTLLYSTFVGGSNDDFGYGITVDSVGNTYVTGYTLSVDFPTKNANSNFPNPYDDLGYYTSGDALNGEKDAFVLKLSANGSTLFYSTYIGGMYDDIGKAIAVDNNGNAYVTGYKMSTNFPLIGGDMESLGVNDVFFVKLSQNGTNILYDQIFGGDNDDFGNDIALDNFGNIYVTGTTLSTFFSAPGGFQNLKDYCEVFVFKLSSTNFNLMFTKIAESSGYDYGNSLVVDSENNTYVTGNTQAGNFLNSVDTYDYSSGSFNSFVFKLSANGSTLLYSTYIGGTDFDYAYGITLDSNGNNAVYITGYTKSSNFHTVNAFNSTFGGSIDMFVAKLSANGSLLYSTFIGGSNNEYGYGIVVDDFGSVYIAGTTSSPTFPIIQPPDSPFSSFSTLNDSIIFKLINIQNCNSKNELIPSIQQIIPHNSSQTLELTLNSPYFNSMLVSYNVYRATNSGSYVYIGNSIDLDFIDNEVERGIYYKYKITVVYAFGEAFYSNESIGVLAMPPSPPTLYNSIGINSVYLTWTPPLSDRGSLVSNYSLYRSLDNISYSFISSTTKLFYNDTTVLKNKTYYYFVTAINLIGESKQSNSLKIHVIATIPSAPSVQTFAGNCSVFLTWTKPSDNGGSVISLYKIYRGTQSGIYSNIGITTNLFFNDTEITYRNKYYYVISAVNAVGEGVYSNELSVVAYLKLVSTTTSIIITTITETSIENQTNNSTSTSKTNNSPGFEIFSVLIIFIGISFVIIKRKRS